MYTYKSAPSHGLLFSCWGLFLQWGLRNKTDQMMSPRYSSFLHHSNNDACHACLKGWGFVTEKNES